MEEHMEITKEEAEVLRRIIRDWVEEEFEDPIPESVRKLIIKFNVVYTTKVRFD